MDAVDPGGCLEVRRVQYRVRMSVPGEIRVQASPGIHEILLQRGQLGATRVGVEIPGEDRGDSATLTSHEVEQACDPLPTAGASAVAGMQVGGMDVDRAPILEHTDMRPPGHRPAAVAASHRYRSPVAGSGSRGHSAARCAAHRRKRNAPHSRARRRDHWPGWAAQASAGLPAARSHPAAAHAACSGSACVGAASRPCRDEDSG